MNISFNLKKIELQVAVSFFFSGVAALIYQICWNRILYGAIGVDIDSTTIIVSCFMLGIGLGGLFGGHCADAFPEYRVRIYIIIELLMCGIGAGSFLLLNQVNELTLYPGLFGLAVTVFEMFILLLIPTVLMGMTLPILVTEFEENFGNMGKSVGVMYFFNTLGASLGACITPFYLFHWLDVQQCTWIASGLNLATAIIAIHALLSFSKNKK
jgi:MFS family permease